MFNKKDDDEEIVKDVKLSKSKDGNVSIKPLKDFVIHHNDIHIELKEGEECEVPSMFLDNLKAEKII